MWDHLRKTYWTPIRWIASPAGGCAVDSRSLLISANSALVYSIIDAGVLRQFAAYSVSCARYNMIGPRGPSWPERWHTAVIQGTGRAAGR